jgi:hypothetical protein
MYQNPLFDKIEIKKQPVLNYLMPYYFTKINNYKGRKNEPTKWKKIRKGILKIETKK